MHKLIPVFFSIYEPIFAYTSSFLLQTDRCSRRLFSGSNGKLIFVLRVFALRAVLKEGIKLINRRITVLWSSGFVASWTKETKTRGRGQSAAFVFAACGISPPPFSSKEVPVLLGQAELPDCIQVGAYDGFTTHCKITVLTDTEYCFFFPL
jgi:hypothetical protein